MVAGTPVWKGGAVLNEWKQGVDEFEAFGAPPEPKRFGPYVVLGELGTGGMGTVYRALDTRLERQVAVKVLHREMQVSGPRERFLREARVVSSLNHPNICVVFDIGEQDGDPYLVMELLRGESLKERMTRGPLAVDDIREVAFRVGLALQAAHAKGIVHRDIKPANLFLMDDGCGSRDVKVLDFGLAKLETEDRLLGFADGLTRAGATVGTVEYMSPEQACGEALDARSDLFSLGAVLYEMATGTVPFHGATSAIVFSELLNRDPVPPRERNLQVPASLDGLIRALLTKDRKQRMGSATAMLDALAEGSVETSAAVRRPDGSAVKATAGHVTQPEATVVQSRPASRPDAEAPWPASVGTTSPARALDPPREIAVELLDPGPAFPARASRRMSSGVQALTVPMVRKEQTSAAEDRVHVGWKVALAAGVVVVLLVTLLVILLMSQGAATTTTQASAAVRFACRSGGCYRRVMDTCWLQTQA